MTSKSAGFVVRAGLVFALGLTGVLPGAAINAAHAQAWPAKPVRLLTSGASGGPVDIVTRGFSQAMGNAFKQAFTVENRPGADGLIAGEACARATPDAYTLCVMDGFVVATNPAVRSKMPFDPAKDLEPIAHLGMLAATIGAHPSVPANNLAELLVHAKANPNKITWASYGAASSAILYMEWLRNVRGIDFYNVPYKSAAPAFQAVISGEVQLIVYSAGLTLSQIRAGKMKALAINTQRRHPLLPDVPTMAESGLDVAVVTWFGAYAPTGTSKEIVRRINAEVPKAFFGDPAIAEKFLNPIGVVVQAPAGGTPEAFVEFFAKEREMYVNLVKAAKIKVE
jgi:tripartite-type tricarboxylate transporter receptor subunit TctC